MSLGNNYVGILYRYYEVGLLISSERFYSKISGIFFLKLIVYNIYM